MMATPERKKPWNTYIPSHNIQTSQSLTKLLNLTLELES
jgi:hypothetical protein